MAGIGGNWGSVCACILEYREEKFHTEQAC